MAKEFDQSTESRFWQQKALEVNSSFPFLTREAPPGAFQSGPADQGISHSKTPPLTACTSSRFPSAVSAFASSFQTSSVSV